jgi:hypothetical protein
MLAYAAALCVALVAMAGALATATPITGSWWVVFLLAVVAAIAERGSVQMSSTMDLEESISLLPTLFAAVLLGPLAGLLVASASMLGDFRKPYLRSVVYTATRGLNGGITGLIALAVADVASSQLGSIVAATLAGAIAAQLLDIAFACLTVGYGAQQAPGRPRERSRPLRSRPSPSTRPSSSS